MNLIKALNLSEMFDALSTPITYNMIARIKKTYHANESIDQTIQDF